MCIPKVKNDVFTGASSIDLLICALLMCCHYGEDNVIHFNHRCVRCFLQQLFVGALHFYMLLVSHRKGTPEPLLQVLAVLILVWKAKGRFPTRF